MATFKMIVTGLPQSGISRFLQTANDPALTASAMPRSAQVLRQQLQAAHLELAWRQITPVYALVLIGLTTQQPTEAVWEHVAIGRLGQIILVDSCRPATLRQTQHLIRRVTGVLQSPFVVAATKQDCFGALPPTYIHQRLGLADTVPVLPCVTHDQHSVHAVIDALCLAIEAAIATE
jgi:signal recognition particle receptor subunit beta